MLKRLLCMSTAALLMVNAPMAAAAMEGTSTYVSVTGYDANVDYTAQIYECLKDGSPYAIEVGYIYEHQRNLKIRDMGLSQYQETDYFSRFDNADEILNAMESDKETQSSSGSEEHDTHPTYSDEDLYWLSRVVYAEAGCNWFPDWVQQAVASVVVNRVNDSRYPNTIRDVIFQSGQYGCVNNGSIYNTPTSKVVTNCKYVLEHGSTLPSYVIGQSGMALGPVYTSYYDSVLGTTIYFFSV